MPATIPSPLPKWSKWAIAIGATPNSYLVSFLTYLGTMGHSTDPSPGEWRHVHLRAKNNVTLVKADEVLVTLDLANITNGGIDSSWTAGDYAITDPILTELLDSWATLMAPDYSWSEIRYYRRAYNPYTMSQPFTLSGPPDHVVAHSAPGLGTARIASQVAMTHTEVTTYPHHWGRSYWPAPASVPNLGTGAYFTQGAVDTWAAELQRVYDELMVAQFFPCVPTTQVQKQPSRQLLGVQAIQVDDVPDIVRRRRLRNTTYRKLLPVTP